MSKEKTKDEIKADDESAAEDAKHAKHGKHAVERHGDRHADRHGDDHADRALPIQNYVVTCFQLGAYLKGTVIPHSEAIKSGNLQWQIDQRNLSPTDDEISPGVGEGAEPVDREAARNLIQLQQTQRQLQQTRLALNEAKEKLRQEEAQKEHFGKRLVESETETARVNDILSQKSRTAENAPKELVVELKRREDELEKTAKELEKTRADLQKAQAEIERNQMAQQLMAEDEPKKPLPKDDPDKKHPK